MSGSVLVERTEITSCVRDCGPDSKEHAVLGFTYVITFLDVQTVTVPTVTVRALRSVAGNQFTKIEIMIMREGEFIEMNEKADEMKGTNMWLTPFSVLLFNTSTAPPITLTESIEMAIWFCDYQSIEHVLRISLPERYAATYLRVQKHGFGVLSVAEIKVYSQKLNTIDYYKKGTPVQQSAITRPYEPAVPFFDSFQFFATDGRWNIRIEQDGSNDQPDVNGLFFSHGSISDVVLVITDHAGDLYTNV